MDSFFRRWLDATVAIYDLLEEASGGAGLDGEAA